MLPSVSPSPMTSDPPDTHVTDTSNTERAHLLWLSLLVVGSSCQKIQMLLTQHPKLLKVHICVNIPSITLSSIYQKCFRVFQFDFAPCHKHHVQQKHGSTSSCRPVCLSFLQLAVINLQVCVGSVALYADASILLTGDSVWDDWNTHTHTQRDGTEGGSTYERFQGWVWNGRALCVFV